jgi:hypothetical protein
MEDGPKGGGDRPVAHAQDEDVEGLRGAGQERAVGIPQARSGQDFRDGGRVSAPPGRREGEVARGPALSQAAQRLSEGIRGPQCGRVRGRSSAAYPLAP